MQQLMQTITLLLQDNMPEKRELGFRKAIDIGVEFLNNCIAAAGGKLNLSYTDVTFIPTGVIVGGDCNLSYCKSLQYIGDNINVGGVLQLQGCDKIRSIGDNISTGSCFRVWWCNALEFIGENISVGGFFSIIECDNFHSLGEYISVDWNFTIEKCKAFKALNLPKNLKAKGKIKWG